jgi:hypothetical protein
MRVVCAWCQREGTPALLGEREPLDDPTETHGICERHRRHLLADAYTRVQSGVRLLFVIAPGETKLYDYLMRSFAGLAGVEVIMERRLRDRRRSSLRVAHERRVRERRVREGESFALGFTMVRFGDEPAPPDSPSKPS